MNKDDIFLLKWQDKKRLPELVETIFTHLTLRKKELVAIKTHFGEEGNKGHIKPDCILPFIKACKEKKANPFLTDTNTIYRGKRDNAVSHLTLAGGHGFLQHKIGVPVIIADGLFGKDYKVIEVNGKHFKSVKIASAIAEASTMIVLSHFKGHIVAGIGGALKNLGMGCAAKVGKYEMHSGACPDVTGSRCIKCGKCIDGCPADALSLDDNGICLDKSLCVGCGECVAHCPTGALAISWHAGAELIQERLVEYAIGAVRDKQIIYINFINHITAECDCLAKDDDPIAPDIGILAGLDPVAIDQASYDLVKEKAGKDVFKDAHPNADGSHQLIYAQKLGLGSRNYSLKNI